MDLTFPYPVMGAIKRPAGQGCKICVHRGYCPAVYWMRRYGETQMGSTTWSEPDAHIGVQCASWSIDPADQVRVVNQGDLDEEDYIWIHGTGAEADRSGMTAPTTGTSRRP